MGEPFVEYETRGRVAWVTLTLSAGRARRQSPFARDT
jgi:hypothetical protein